MRISQEERNLARVKVWEQRLADARKAKDERAIEVASAQLASAQAQMEHEEAR